MRILSRWTLRSSACRLLTVGFFTSIFGFSGAIAQGANNQSINGGQIYLQSRCYACHGNNGGGTLGPSLAGDKLLGISSYVISQILIGRGEMPAFAEKLSDKQIAAVAQYIRNSWGNNFGPVSADEVAKTRKMLSQSSENAAPSQPATPQRQYSSTQKTQQR